MSLADPPASPPATRGARRDPVILFDLDGTLIDTMELLVSAMEHAFSSREGRRPTVEEWVSTIGRPLVWQFSQYASGDEDLQQLVRTYRAFQHEHHDRLTRPYEGVSGLVQRLHEAGHPLGVVTSKSDPIAHRSLGHVGLAPFFDVVVGTERTEKHKPEPDPVWFALRELGASPEQAVYIGDSPFDVMAANSAGATSIGVTWGASAREQLLEAGSAHIVSTVLELEGLIAKLGAPPHVGEDG